MQDLIFDEKKYQLDQYQIMDREIIIEAHPQYLRQFNDYSGC